MLFRRSLARKVGVSVMDVCDWLFLVQGLGHYNDAMKDLDALLAVEPNDKSAIRERELLEQLQVGGHGHTNNVILCPLQSADEGHTTVDL